tara:strand:+ start:4576 stop:4833 length:258 start_codon:yes stop_codon:yes gene_type:complete
MYYAQGYNDKLDIQMDMLAWHAAVCVQPHVKKGTRVTPSKLRGKKQKIKSTRSVLDQIDEEIEKREQDAFWEKGPGKEWHQAKQE